MFVAPGWRKFKIVEVLYRFRVEIMRTFEGRAANHGPAPHFSLPFPEDRGNSYREGIPPPLPLPPRPILLFSNFPNQWENEGGGGGGLLDGSKGAILLRLNILKGFILILEQNL